MAVLNMLRRRHFLISGAAWFSLTGWATSSLAYSTDTHQRIVDEGWQTIRALAATNLTSQIRSHGMSVGTDADLTFGSPPSFCALPASDPKNLCGEQITAQNPGDWNQFITDAKTTMQKYSAQSPDLPTPLLPCAGFQTGDPVGNFKVPLTASALQQIPDSNLLHTCDYMQNWRRGVFTDFVTEDDGTGYQGLILGWHATSRDYDFGELWLDNVWVYGNMAKLGAEIGTIGLAAAVFPFVCLWDIFSGHAGDCFNDSWDTGDSVNPANVLTGILK